MNQSGVSLVKNAVTGVARKTPDDFHELIEILCSPGVMRPEKAGAIVPEFLGIIPSRTCNMACAHCDFGAHQEKDARLDADIMITAIDWFAGLCKQNRRKSLPVQFFGGEPFVERELVDIAVHHARFVASRNRLVPHFEVLTNGYYKESRRLFIRDYFDHVIVSLDGFKVHHDQTRMAAGNKSTYETVVETVKSLSGHNIQLSIRCCVTSESVQDMEKIAAWFCRKFKPDKVNFETLTENPQTRRAGLCPPDPYVFAEHCIKAWRVLREHGVEPAYAPVALNKPQTTSCPVGRDVVILHPDGMIASCYLQEVDWTGRGMDLSVGFIRNGKVELDKEQIHSFRNQLEAKSRCRNCFCRYGCAGGCHVNNTYPGCSSVYENFCIHTRIITACRLLEEMGEESLVDALLQDETALENLALYPSDKLLDFEDRK